ASFPEEADIVFSDERNHASLIDGIRLARARRVVFPHNDVRALGSLLRSETGTGQKFLVTESLFSMDGHAAPLASYAELCRGTNTALIVDEAHAVGIYGGYHIMVGLGTSLVAVMALVVWLVARGRLYANRAALWLLLFMTPFPYIATTAGWMTAELGRQPWLIYGLMRTASGLSPHVSSGSGLFTLLGFMGLYMVLGILFLFLVWHEIEHGPETA